MSNETRGWKRVVKTLSFLLFSLAILVLARGPGATQSEAEEVRPDEDLTMPELPETPEVTSAEEVVEVVPGYVTMDFKDADIHNVLRILSYKSGVNIIAGPQVRGKVTVRLVDVPWERALRVILETYDFGYERVGNIITVSPMERLTAKKKAEQELAEVQPVVTKVFNLQYLDAGDVKEVLEPQLSPRGKITVLAQTGQRGWVFGAEFGKRERVEKLKKVARSKTLVISDILPSLERIEKVIKEIDVRPQQVLIETRVVEVNRDKLLDIGFDWGTGADGLPSLLTKRETTKTYYWTVDDDGYPIKATYDDLTTLPTLDFPDKPRDLQKIGAQFLPGYDTGLELLFQRLTGTKFEVLLRALEQEGEANILSAPRIMTLNNQEASILVGEKFPILKSEVEDGIPTTSLEYWQDIGIQLSVVPQISGDDHINMIVHPAVTSYTRYVEATAGAVVTAKYPIIITREAETQVLIKDGETIVIGGLLKDVKSEILTGIPILSKIPILGFFFDERLLRQKR